MANAKSALEKVNKEFGVKTTTTTKKKDNGKQSTSASPKSSSTTKNNTSKETNTSTNNKAKLALEKVNKEFGIQSSPITSSKPSTKKYTDYNTETKNAYTSIKNKVNTKFTTKGNLSEAERKARIKEIDSEAKALHNQLSGYSRAKAYGTSKAMLEKEQAVKDRIAELAQEKKTLERTGTFSVSELKQFEIDDAKAKKSALPTYNPTARVAPSSVEAFKKNVSEHYALDKEIDTLEREKALYDDVAKFGTVANEDNFVGQWKANYRSNELSREADKAMSEYIMNPTEENKQIAYAYDAFAKEYLKNNEKALDDENVKASWLTKSMAGYLPQFKDQIVPELVGGGIGLLAGSAVGAPNVGMSVGAGLGTYSQTYDVMRGSVYRALLAEGVDAETALKAAEDEALISSLIEGGETALSWLLAGGGKAISAISGAAKASVAKGSTNSATKFLADLATKGLNKTAANAAKAVTTPLWKTGVRTVGGIVGNAATEYLEEFTQGAVSEANRERALSGNPVGGKGQLIKGASNVVSDAVTGKNPEVLAELHGQGVEGFKIGLMFGGSQTIVNNVVSHYANAKTVERQNEVVDTILEDEESLNALIEEGKASGEGTVSAKIAKEIEQAKEKGEVTREQVKQLIESNEVYIKAEEQIAEPTTLEQTAQASENEPVSNAFDTEDNLPTQEEKTFKTYRMNSVLGDAERTTGVADGQTYVTNSKDILPSPTNRSVFIAIDNTEAAKTELGATESTKTSADISKILTSDFVPVRENFVDGTLENVGEVRVFTDENGREIALERNTAEYFEGYNLEATFRGGKPYAIKATDNDGNVAGVAMAVWTDKSGKTYDITYDKATSQPNTPYNVMSNENPMLQERQAREAYIQKATGYGKYGVRAFADIMETVSESEAPVVAKSFRTAYEAGLTNLDTAQATLPTQVHQIAFNAGKQDYIMENVSKKENVKNVKSHGDKAGFDSTNVPSNVSKQAVDIANRFCKELGVKAWMTGDSDMYNANITPNVGVVQVANNFSVLEDLQENFGKDAASLSFVTHVLHEVADHRAEELAPVEYAEFKREMYNYKNSLDGVSLASAKRQEYGNKGVDISLSEAMSEVTANSILELYDNDFDLLAEGLDRVLNGTNAKAKKGANIFKQALDYVIDKFNKFLNKLGAETRKPYNASLDEVIKVRDAFEKALGAAIAKNKEIAKSSNLVTEKNGTIVDAKGNVVAQINEDGTATFSLKTFDDSGRTELKKWLDRNVKNKKLTEAEANDISEQLEYYYDICKGYEDKYAPFSAWSKAEVVKGLDGKPLMSVVKANGDYSMNLDFSLVCKKRRPLDALYRAMIDDGFMDNIGQLSEVEVARINEIIRKNGFETACTLCFVDSKRYRQYAVADNFVSKYNELVKMLAPEGTKIDRFDFSGRRQPSADGLHTMSNADLKSGINKLNKVIKEHGETTVVGKIANHLKAVPQDRKLVMVSDFMDSEGFVRVKKANPDVFKLYNSSKGSGGPKATLPDVQYLGEILKKSNFTPKKAYAVGGVRVQSFSDYIPRLVFDYLQMTADLSAKKLPAHAYSKEDIFVMQFGKTGIKINMSLVPAVAKDGIAAGLDKDGNYVWVDGHTFASDFHDKGSGQRGFELAVKIQNTEGYSQNCGTIAVGVSDEHIIKMLKDNDIRMVIPYHKSSLNHFVAKMGNIDQYKDYTNVQNTRDRATGKKIEGKDFNFNEAFHRLGDAKEATNEYLAWCEKNNYIPKFDTFAFHEDAEVRENYYKVLIDFAAYDSNGNSIPQGAVTMNFPTENDAFGSMKSLIEKGLEADAILEGRKAENIPKILQEVKSVLGAEGKKYSLKVGEVAQKNTDKKGGADNDTIDLTNNTDLSARIENQRGSKKYKIIRDYILEVLGEEPIVLSDGIVAKVDKSDALHLANKSANKKIAYIAKIKTIIERAKLFAIDNQVEHKKFDEFRYYQANVKYGDEAYSVYLNVGRAKNGDGYHIYDITKKIGATVKQKDALERVENDLRSETDSPISSKIISHNPEFVKGEFSATTDAGLSGTPKYSLKGTERDIPLRDIPKVRKAVVDKNVDVLAKYVDSGAMSTELYNQLIEEFGAIPRGENPSRDVIVPKKTADDKKVSQTVRTILEAKVTPDEAVPTIEKMVEDGIFSYDVYTDKQAIADSENYIKEYGWDESLDDWFDAVEKGEVSKELTTMGWALYNNAANLAATTTSETERTSAIKTSLKILDAMVRHQRSAAQALQATRILKKLSPETQLYGVQKSVQALQKELTEKYGDKAPDLKIDEELAEQFLTAETEEARAEVEKKIYKDIGRQMPSRFIDKWNAWRYLAMLGNPRTHIRNIFGNAFFAPVVATKNLTATAIESVVYRVSGKKTVRGKSIIIGNKADRALLKAAWNDYANVADMVSNGGKYNDFAMANQQIEEGRQIFKFKPLEWARKGNSKALEAEDVWFSKPHYAYALAQYCKANNITAEQIQKGKAIAPARNYAIKEAQKATYKDTNAFSQMVSEWGRNKNETNVAKKALNTVIEGILPFRKTPANILARGVEYSPIGLLKGLSYDLVQASKGKMTSSKVIDNISAGLTGTGLLALGVYLAAQGLVRGHGEDEEKEKKFNEMMGHQAYSLELPNGQSITLDWLAPEALPFFVGVNMWETTKGSEEETNLSSVLQSITHITEPMLEMSCLQGLNDLLEGIGYASSNDTSGLVSVVSSAVTSYLTQGIPTLSGQAERTGEEERMTTYTEKNDFLTGDMQYTLGKASAKIPFWDYNQIPYIDAWGRKEASGTKLKRGLNNFLNPAYTSTIETSKMEDELLRLYEQTGEGGVFPERADKYFMVDGERKDLTAEEYERYATLKGEKSYKMVSELVNSREYKKLSDEEKVKAVKDAYDYANQKAKKAISNYKPEKWVNTADEFGEDAENFIFFRTNVSATREANGGKIKQEEVVDIISDTAQNNSEAWTMYLSMYDSKTAIAAEKNGIDAELFMTAVVDMESIKADYKSNGKVISGSRRSKIEKYLNSVCNSYKEYLFLLGTEYDSVKDDYDYVSYFGKEED